MLAGSIQKKILVWGLQLALVKYSGSYSSPLQGTGRVVASQLLLGREINLQGGKCSNAVVLQSDSCFQTYPSEPPPVSTAGAPRPASVAASVGGIVAEIATSLAATIAWRWGDPLIAKIA